MLPDDDGRDPTQSVLQTGEGVASTRAQASDPSAPTVASDPESATLGQDGGKPAAWVGMTIDGRYLIERSLGRGGMGQVYLAKDLQLHSRPVVIKLLLEEAYNDPYMLKKFRQEIEALSRIDHPGVIGIIEAGELSDTKPFIVMQYVDGVTLRSAIRTEGMNLERAADILGQIGRALTAAHDRGILHRDLKPENVMLQNLGHGEELVKIIDFGIAKIRQSVIAPSTAKVATAGTISYMAPEQLSAKPVTVAADIYSLGIIAYEMVTGRRPFNPETGFELLDMQRAGVRVKPVDLRPSLPPMAQTSILKALAFEPRDRYRSAREFGEEVARGLLNESEAATVHFADSAGLTATIPSAESTDRARAKTIPGQVAPIPTTPPASDPFPGTQLTPPSRPTSRIMFSLHTPWLKVAIGLFSFAVIASSLYGLMVMSLSSRSVPSANSGSGAAAPVTANAPPLSASANRGNSPTVAASNQPVFNYWLTVQKMRDGKPYEDPFESSGREIFENGYAFRLNASSPRSGYLYVFNEGATASGDMSFTIIYPTPVTNGGSAKTDENHPVQTNWNRFGGRPGTEEFWMIWSSAPVPELEAAKEAAFKSEKGKITDAGLLRSVREFLLKHSEPKPEVTKDSLKQQTTVRGGDPLVQLVELEHR